MKNMIIVVAMLVCAGCAAATPVKQEDMTYQKVIDLPKQSKDAVFEKSKQWIAVTFKSAKAVIEYDSKSEGVIIGNGSMKRPISAVHISGDGTISYTMREDIKDGKARLLFDNLTAYSPPSYNTITGALPGGAGPIMGGDLEGMRLNFDELAASLQKYILNGSGDSW